ncbi:uncharacterized protein YALI1_B06146g [Yarrowia lipolytica]|uniref:Uncharacterized protein n=1 Tax=Yarrowia lipolytica TaxID=4952 RepID=A0A1D8N6G0_YARLL|nr:hypothetical protein YALI1_B06146g [Yarrowia lipolytica]
MEECVYPTLFFRFFLSFCSFLLIGFAVTRCRVFLDRSNEKSNANKLGEESTKVSPVTAPIYCIVHLYRSFVSFIPCANVSPHHLFILYFSTHYAYITVPVDVRTLAAETIRLLISSVTTSV